MNLKQQLRRLKAFGFLSALRMTDAVWVVFLIGRGFSLWQAGAAEGVFHAVSLLCEIPSGMAADLIGRRRCLALSGLCGLVSALLMIFCNSFGGICLAMACSALSCSFISGSDEALLYDSLLESQQADRYLSASAGYTQMQNLAGLFSNTATVLAKFFGYIGFYCMDAAVCTMRMLTALTLTEPTVTENQTRQQEHPFRNLKARFEQHVRTAALFLKEHPSARLLMLADGLVTLPSYLTLMFLQQRLNDLGVAVMWLGVPVVGIMGARMLGVALGERIRPRSLPGLYAVAAAIVGLGTICAGAAGVVPAVLGAMAAAAAMDAWVLHLQKHLNGLYPSDQRATLVSVNMMAYSVLMVIASPLVGWLGDITHLPGAGLCALGGVIVLSSVLTLLHRKG